MNSKPMRITIDGWQHIADCLPLWALNGPRPLDKADTAVPSVMPRRALVGVGASKALAVESLGATVTGTAGKVSSEHLCDSLLLCGGRCCLNQAGHKQVGAGNLHGCGYATLHPVLNSLDATALFQAKKRRNP